ncbi:hypothetical protein M8C21_000480, partial [Ambrosia artemisiifolia]
GPSNPKASVKHIFSPPSKFKCLSSVTSHLKDAMTQLGGPSWKVKLGRRDSTTASRAAANANIPAPSMDLPALIKNFKDQGLDEEDLVVLSGAHTLGFAQCRTFRTRIYNDTNIDPAFASHLRTICPQVGGDSTLAPLDPTPSSFDVKYFTNLVSKKGLLHSDQALFNGGETDELVSKYNGDHEEFWEDFAESMIKMGDIKPLTGNRVKLGRRDSTTASRIAANANIPSPLMDLPALIKNFKDQGLNEKDLVVLSGAHTLGFAECRAFRNRIYNDTNIDPVFVSHLRTICPQVGGDSKLAPLDPTPSSFDVKYFSNLLGKKGLLSSDQALFNGGETDELVSKYSRNHEEFWEDFAKSMIKMGDIKPLTGKR